MRLVCPNCEAEYEVDDGIIPAEGRDVQCSNCTTTWFQAGVASGTAEKIAEDSVAPSAPDNVSETSDAEDVGDDAVIAAAAAVAVQTPRKPAVDKAAMDIIHEEVARETAARQAERGGIETQPDLGLDDTETQERATAARDRMARRRGIEPSEDTIEEADDGLTAAPKRDESAKKELFPDIEEINSTLSPEAAEAEAEAAKLAEQAEITPQKAARSSFRIGFGLILLIFVGLLLLYVYAPQIGARMPSSAGPLESYVSTVNSIRVSLDNVVQGLVERIGTTLESKSTGQ